MATNRKLGLPRSNMFRIAILVCVLGLVAAACGDDESGDTTTTAATDTTVEATTTTGATGTTAAPETTTNESMVEPAMSYADANLEPLETPTTLSMQVNPAIPFNLPFFWALDQGYFEDVGLEIVAETGRVPYSQNLPRLITGDLDILVGGNPAPLYNQLAQGFGAQLVATNGIPHEGRVEPILFAVLADRADEFNDLADLEGRSIEAAGKTTGGWVLAALALEEAGLVEGEDVQLGDSIKSVADMLTAAENQVADVIVMAEPIATQAQELGFVQKWLGFYEIAPWREATFITMGAETIANEREAVVKFLEVYLLASREIEASQGEWTPELIATMADWSGQEPDTVTAAGLIPYFHPNGAIDIEGLGRIQDLFVENELVETPIDVNEMVNLAVLDEALETIGRVDVSG